jgi:hypothetical protein
MKGLSDFLFGDTRSPSFRALESKLRDKYRQEDESKYRCVTCSKMFKNTGYVCKHIANKHPELIPEEFTYEVGFIDLSLEKTSQ